jgi:ABC-type phosphate/phosphonate transport system substrate-binding protein
MKVLIQPSQNDGRDVIPSGSSRRRPNMIFGTLSKWAVAVVFFLLVVATWADGTEKTITIAISPCTDVVMSFKKFNPLVTYLKEQTGLDVRLVVPRDSADFERDIKSGAIDFALQDPNVYLMFAPLYDKGTLIRALTPEGGTSQSGVVIVRKDGNINQLKDLTGKTVMFGPKLSAARWVAAKLLFEENGINIDQDLKAYSHGRCCEDIAFSVYLKAVDAGVVCDHFLEEHSKKQKELGVEIKQIRVIARTGLVSTRVFAARLGTSKSITAQINEALLRLDKNKPAHAKILSPAELGGFQKSEDKDYDTIRMLIDTER